MAAYDGYVTVDQQIALTGGESYYGTTFRKGQAIDRAMGMISGDLKTTQPWAQVQKMEGLGNYLALAIGYHDEGIQYTQFETYNSVLSDAGINTASAAKLHNAVLATFSSRHDNTISAGVSQWARNVVQDLSAVIGRVDKPPFAPRNGVSTRVEFGPRVPAKADATFTAKVGEAVEIYASCIGQTQALVWYKDSVLIPGESNRGLFISSLALEDSGEYYLVATNDNGPKKSINVNLVVTE